MSVLNYDERDQDSEDKSCLAQDPHHGTLNVLGSTQAPPSRGST